MYSVYFFIGGLVTSAFTIAAGSFGLRTGTNSNFVLKSLIMAMVSDLVVFVYLGFNVWAFMNWAFNEAYFTSKFLHCLVHGLQIIFCFLAFLSVTTYASYSVSDTSCYSKRNKKDANEEEGDDEEKKELNDDDEEGRGPCIR